MHVLKETRNNRLINLKAITVYTIHPPESTPNPGLLTTILFTTVENPDFLIV